ncbi:lipopolysaccharide biosynthesis protein [uncultured Jatrophihabitans sp.]|uniref:lipopolysaccharide biosynthesis protein n=1 Tax=uncultured Jatrophihabitans sp. TaxID=1610747 RepID=UPI0035CBCA90
MTADSSALRPAPRPTRPAAAPVSAPRGGRFSLKGGVRHVAGISAALVGTQAVTGILGLLYWAVAARLTSVTAVGVAGAATSLMLLLGSFGMLGLGTLLIAEIPRTDPATRRLLVRTALVVAGVASTVFGALVAIGVGSLGLTDLSSIATPFNVVDFAIGTGITGLCMVLDQAVLVVGLSRVQLERNTLASVAKIVILIGLVYAGRRSGMDIFLSWTLGNLVSLGLVAMRTRVRTSVVTARAVGRRLVDLGLLRRLARSAASHHALNLMLQAPMLLLSVVVAAVLSAEANGYFSTARSIAGFVFVLPFSITIALFASAQGRERELAQRMRFTIPFGIAASLVADAVLWPLGPTVLSAFGHSYSVEALTTLRVLVLAGLPFVIKDHFVALRRTQNRTGNAAVIALLGAVFELVAAVIGAKVGGTVGLCSFWVGALAVEAVLLTGPILRAARAPAPVDPPPPPALHRRPRPGPRHRRPLPVPHDQRAVGVAS